jgi:hypothetical protein
MTDKGNNDVAREYGKSGLNFAMILKQPGLVAYAVPAFA